MNYYIVIWIVINLFCFIKFNVLCVLYKFFFFWYMMVNKIYLLFFKLIIISFLVEGIERSRIYVLKINYLLVNFLFMWYIKKVDVSK